MALNNQTALLKVVENVVYFSVTAVPAVLSTTTAAAVQQQTFTTTAQTVPVGLVMSVTPQISDNGQVTLTVRPTITRFLQFRNDPNPTLANPCGTTAPCPERAVTSGVPEVQTREMESVLQLVSGQTAILGGLMQDNIDYKRNVVPGIANLSGPGILSGIRELFSARSDTLTKTELVIFLRSTIITNPSLESDELKYFQRFLPQQTDKPTEILPGENAGATK